MKSCKLWPWGLDKEGYAITTVHYKQIRVARAVLEDFLGRKLAANEHTRHLCHNKACVELSHLAPGSARDNALDNYKAGKMHPAQKLSDEDILSIRRQAAAGVSQAKLARNFKLSTSTVSYIVRGLRRAFVTGGCE